MTARTRAIIVASPANPTGAVQERKTMQALADLGVPLVSDEIYDGLVYDGVQTTSALAVSDQAYVLDGFSKRYAMTGFRLGYVIAPLHAVRPLQVLQQNLFISANHFVQYAGVAALEQGAASVTALRDDYAQRRTQLIQGLRELGFGLPSLPQGAFYALADARRFGGDSVKLAFELLERAHVACTPGIDYGQAAEGHLRFSFAATEEDIALGLERLGKVLPVLEAEVLETTENKPRGKK
jgi:aspartate/methionine/tyrosine aminotransferase